MINLITAALLFVGASFCVFAAIGMIRMPDLLTRMQASTKAGTFGVGFVVLSVAVHFGDVGTTTRAALAIAFLLLTAPVAAHMIGRAAYIVGTPIWKGTVQDDLRGRYDPKTHALEGDSHKHNNATTPPVHPQDPSPSS